MEDSDKFKNAIVRVPIGNIEDQEEFCFYSQSVVQLRSRRVDLDLSVES